MEIVLIIMMRKITKKVIFTGYVAIDERDGDLTSRVVVSDTPTPASSGRWYLYYEVVDSSGNETIARWVIGTGDSGTYPLPVQGMEFDRVRQDGIVRNSME